MSRTWKDLRPDQRETAKRFSERRAANRGQRRNRGEGYLMVARERLPRRAADGQERAA